MKSTLDRKCVNKQRLSESVMLCSVSVPAGERGLREGNWAEDDGGGSVPWVALPFKIWLRSSQGV